MEKLDKFGKTFLEKFGKNLENIFPKIVPGKYPEDIVPYFRIFTNNEVITKLRFDIEFENPRWFAFIIHGLSQRCIVVLFFFF